MQPLETTTIGSFPLEPSPENIRICARIQAEAGIDYPAVPQLEDFCMLFLKRMRGLRIEGDRVILEDLIEPGEISEIMDQVSETISELERHDVKGVKAQITGPVTLGSIVEAGEAPLIQYPDLYETLVETLCEIARRICDFTPIKVVFIDEPAIPGALWAGVQEDLIISSVNRVVEAIRGRGKVAGMHVCGRIVEYDYIFLKTGVTILHHEYKGTPDNIQAYSRRVIEETGKMVGIGCVKSKPEDTVVRVEDVSEVLETIVTAAGKYGAKNIILAPDCGFAPLKHVLPRDEAIDVVRRKLEKMVEAAGKARKMLIEGD